MKKNIISDPNIMGGSPVIAGTRIPISVIIYRLKDGYSIKQIHDMYPWVPLEKLEAVLDELAERLAQTTDDQKVLQA